MVLTCKCIIRHSLHYVRPLENGKNSMSAMRLETHLGPTPQSACGRVRQAALQETETAARVAVLRTGRVFRCALQLPAHPVISDA